MQTQCPHCDTRFRVTESQVNTADGFVRCSVCKEIFNAIEVASQDEHQHSLLSEENPDNIPYTLIVDDNSFDGDSQDTYVDDFDDRDIESTLEDELEAEVNSDTITDTEDVNFNETSATDEARKDAFDFFDEDSNESLSHVVPDKYRNSDDTDRASVTTGIFWGIGITLLCTTLFAEYLWFNRNQLSQHTQLKTWADDLCQQFECKDVAMRDPSQIELVTRNVYSHPNEKNALMINVTLKNNAKFSQPLPVMQVSFSDIRGAAIASRRFLPEEYLPIEDQPAGAKRLHILQPDTNITFTMAIQDPGKQALTYEFDFL